MLPEFKYANSWAIYLLVLVIPLIIGRIYLRLKRVIKYSPLQYGRLKPYRMILPYMPLFLEACITLLLIIILAGPYKEGRREFISEEGVDIALLLDVSSSMQAADFPPNRLEALKRIASDFVKRSGSNRIAVYAFAKHTFTQTPLTTDHSIILELIDGIAFEMIDHTVSGGTAVGDSLLRASDTLVKNRIKGRDQAIILITDGQNNTGIDPSTSAKFVRENNIRLYIIGIGGDKPVEVYINGKPFINVNNQVLTTFLDDRQLRDIAHIAGGRYFRAKNVDILMEIFNEISRLEKTPLEIETFTIRKYFRPELGLIILLFFTLYIILEGLLLRRPLR